MLDSLRQPLETGETAIARANYRVTYPSRFQLIAAMNPCRCGMAGEPGHSCRRGPRCMTDYQARLSGPLMDRIDIRIDVPSVSAADMLCRGEGEASAAIAARVLAARRLQAERFARWQTGAGEGPASQFEQTAGCVNAAIPAMRIEEVATPDAAGTTLLRDAAEKLKFSVRAYHRILKVARTIADLEGAGEVGRIHVAEAIAYRRASDRLPAAA